MSKQRFSEWWLCLTCWIAYAVPTTGYYGDCQQCGKPTIPSVVPPEKMSMLEMKIRAASLRRDEEK